MQYTWQPCWPIAWMSRRYIQHCTKTVYCLEFSATSAVEKPSMTYKAGWQAFHAKGCHRPPASNCGRRFEQRNAARVKAVVR